MTLQRLPNGSVRISRLDEWHLQALRRIPFMADPGDDEKALRRVFPAPFAAGDASEQQQEDWVEFVQPEMQSLFEGSIAKVASDLKSATLSDPEEFEEEEDDDDSEADDDDNDDAESGESVGLERDAAAGEEAAPESGSEKPKEPEPLWELTVPAKHVEDWYRAMNQARLVLSSAKGAHRRDNEYIQRMLASGQIEMLIYYELLTSLCGWWVDVLYRSPGPESGE